ncbi:transcriptional corepressor LEUNIG_HOMOLOG-like [Cannabis sativa]|uniref:transcriptional corepressor LEUNIG_HOMOLOG-like n=1 Tax=Cannabis sativa TaxID=3483 RepID=UPI0029CA2443|nr:transcriptional corepressor LEUNIG_HOMOLOG-like [Cannabis sativa]
MAEGYYHHHHILTHSLTQKEITELTYFVSNLVQKQALQCRNGNQVFEIGTVQEQNQRGYMYENATNNTDKIGCLFTSKSITLCCQFSSNGKYLASADWQIFVWDVGTLSSQSTLTAHSSFITDIRFQPNSSIFASSSFDGTVKKIWDAARSAANHIRFQPNNGKLAFASGNGVGFFNTQTRNVVFTKKVHKETVHLVCWDYYGEHVFSMSEDRVQVWSLSKGECMYQIVSNGNTYHAQFLFLCFLFEQSLKLWNDIGRMRTSFGAHGGNVRALAESKETNMIASAGDDHCVNLWKGKSTNASNY